MPSFIDKSGTRVGHLVVVGRAYTMRRVHWHCRCDCGGWTIVNSALLGGKRPTESCGCLVGLNESQWQEILAAYDGGATPAEAAALHGVTHGALKYQLKRRGLVARPLWEGPTVNESRFRDMATEEEAYWLGMLYTDGSISTAPHPRVALSLAIRDREHVHKFARFLGARHAPHDYSPPSMNGRSRTDFRCQSPALVENLVRQGMHDRKTWTLTPWRGPAHLMRHFWRGCIDGDGCIRRVKNRHSWEVSYVGNEAMCRGLHEFVTASVGDAGGVYEDKRGYSNGQRFYMTMWSGVRSPKAVAELLYSGATVGLDRKMELAAQLAVVTPINYDWSEITAPMLIGMRAAEGTWVAVAAKLGVSCNVLRRYLSVRYHIRVRRPKGSSVKPA